MTTKPSSQLTLQDRLSRLTFTRAARMLGETGKQLLVEGGKFDLDPESHVTLTGDRCAVLIPGEGLGGGAEQVILFLDSTKRRRLGVRCGCGSSHCVHQGAALSLILEEKTALGLAKPPPERKPMESLAEKELLETAIGERRERAASEVMRLKSHDPSRLWADYSLTSAQSGKTYRVALRGWEPGESYCTCPDFRKNTLGTCKHIMSALAKVKRKFPAAVRDRAYKPDSHQVFLRYGKDLELNCAAPAGKRFAQGSSFAKMVGADLSTATKIRRLLKAIEELEVLGRQVTIYPDAEEHINRILHQDRVTRRMNKIRKDPAGHPLRKKLLKNAELLPYQLDGVAFAAGAGRSVLADDMGLGKTIQGIGVAEMLRRESAIERVLIICPASLKSQWRLEIAKFSDLTSQVVVGNSDERSELYAGDAFFTICNYEQVLRDMQSIELVPWDLIILDEAQRIKNWEAKTSNLIKSLRSPYALVLTGTPIENRLDDLYSILEFVDDRRLGPAFRFFNRHRVIDERGKVLGYKGLGKLRKKLSPVLLRRTRASVLSELPPRTTEIVRLTPTEEQAEIDSAQMQIVRNIVCKKYLTEMDILRLQKALLLARMAADSTYLVNKQEPGYSSKLSRLSELLETLCAEKGRKIVLFSEWTTMLSLIEKQLEALGVEYVRLDGSIPQKRRQKLVNQFQNDPDCRLFITTNAGSTGLNLQAANTVINVDLPWNPALLEQRIGRAHRMGQKRPVHVYLLVTEESIEEKILANLSAKHELALAVLDPDSDVDHLDIVSGMEELKRRLEVLLGARPDAPVDASGQEQTEEEKETRAQQSMIERKERVAEAGGQLLSAAFSFLAEMLPATAQSGGREPDDDPTANPAVDAIRQSLRQCVETEDGGKPRLTVTLPDAAALDRLAETLGKLVTPR